MIDKIPKYKKRYYLKSFEQLKKALFANTFDDSDYAAMKNRAEEFENIVWVKKREIKSYNGIKFKAKRSDKK